MSDVDERLKHRITEQAALHRKCDPAFAHWAAGYGVIQHDDLTQVRVRDLATDLVERGLQKSCADVYRLLAAADRLTSAGMWLTVHLTYARNVRSDGRDLAADDFKKTPEGHTGGALNMVPAYVGYLLANSLSGFTRGWLMGQGHTVAAIDSINLLVGNLTPEHAQRYATDDEGLTRFVRDFYSYAMRPDGVPASPLGSHVNPHTAGGLIEGGYLGFAELQYVHMPLPGERLVAFLSDGAFEEQRGSDWAPRWWRAEDSGLVAPIMIANGRRIDQRTTVAQQGGVDWLREHLRLNGFDPIDIDGRDPAAFAWSILEMELRLMASARAVENGKAHYPVPLPYTIAESEKGFGFPGAGTNAAHNLPLGDNPSVDEAARQKFNRGARDLWVPKAELEGAIQLLNNHGNGRVRERDHALMRLEVEAATRPPPHFLEVGQKQSPMAALDHYFVDVVERNPHLRPRVGNPDELRSNGMSATLDKLKHRVTAPEPGVAESLTGKVITALNEEAVVEAALGNKGGINLAVTYEAFAVKMLGALRQELIFSRHMAEIGRPARWISVPLILTSHTWENGKNEQSHQDPTLAEAMLGEMNDLSRVIFPGDGNSAQAALAAAYGERGQIWTLVVPKRPLPIVFDGKSATQLAAAGAYRLRGDGSEKILLGASGAYQLREALRAHDRLRERNLACAVVYLIEPGRFRVPRDRHEETIVAMAPERDALFPATALTRVFLTHTRPEPYLGAIRPLDTGAAHTRVLGYVNRGGTLDVDGMLFANRCTWAHAVRAIAEMTDRPLTTLLEGNEIAALHGEGDPSCLR
jgi:phosphoketolase